VIDLRLGRWEDVLVDVGMVDAVFADPPYSARVHDGHDDGAEIANKRTRIKRNLRPSEPARARRKISYSAWTPADVAAFVDAWVPRCRGWFVCLSDSELCSAYRSAFERNGLTGFQPLPCITSGGSVRMSGDGPSSWAVYANVARPKALCRWGTLPGAYIGKLGSLERADAVVAGAKPMWMMRALVRDYSKVGDLVVDPCAGGATTLIAAAIEGRRAVGAEHDEATYELAMKRIEAGYTPDMFAAVQPP